MPQHCPGTVLPRPPPPARHVRASPCGPEQADITCMANARRALRTTLWHQKRSASTPGRKREPLGDADADGVVGGGLDAEDLEHRVTQQKSSRKWEHRSAHFKVSTSAALPLPEVPSGLALAPCCAVDQVDGVADHLVGLTDMQALQPGNKGRQLPPDGVRRCAAGGGVQIFSLSRHGRWGGLIR